ncbi:uncharacterized protein DFL_007060 [Arthrobotrys flagrans]|uniref:FAD-binding PCMH-type domain-containing protein n=1 Tax=Arthrobotrys flagrans TaxID=97331 RepID=A0A436ZUZ5_ARTFL|nr:hypothetical protein DFL_007060 [Arthrobotrys flagrans]
MEPAIPLRRTAEEIEDARKRIKERTEADKKLYRDFADTMKTENIPVYLPGEAEYERSVANPNLLYRFSRPGCVVQPLSTSDVQTVIKEAREQNISMTIKGGGHSYAGFSTTNDGISLDLGKMNRARLNTKVKPRPVMTMQGGAQWGHAYKHLINGKHDGMIVNGGRCPTVGVGGFILGGGLAPFGRSFGLGCDTLIEATIVTADGDIVTVSRKDLELNDEEKKDPEKVKRRDLFWALCGAGGGNFGVVVEFKLEIQYLEDPEGLVVAGKYEWQPAYEKDEAKPQEDAVVTDETLATMNRFYSYNWPNRCTIDSSWICTIGKPLTIRFLVYYDGLKTQFTQLINPVGVPDDEKPIPSKPLRDMIIRRVIEEPSTRFLHETLVDQWSDEIVRAFPANKGYSLHASFVFPNDIDTIENITRFINADMARFKERYAGETATMQVTWIHSGGKVSEVGDSDTAYPWRQGVYNVYIMLQWDGKWLETDIRGWLQIFRRNLRQYSLEGQAAYVNFPFPDKMELSGTDYEYAYYGKNCDALRKVKEEWDEKEYFKWNQGIKLPKSVEESNSTSFHPATEVVEESKLETNFVTALKVNILSSAEVPVAAKVTNNYKKDKASDRKLADQLALEQWKTFEPFGSWSTSSGGIYALTDLGF